MARNVWAFVYYNLELNLLKSYVLDDADRSIFQCFEKDQAGLVFEYEKRYDDILEEMKTIAENGYVYLTDDKKINELWPTWLTDMKLD